MAEKLTAEEARMWFSYDANSGHLTWVLKPSVGVRVGDGAGVRNPNGYVCVKFRGNQYQAHRIAWLMSFGEWPTGDIDHINGVRSDNRLENLRDVPRSMNVQNVRVARSSNLSCGVLGVTPKNQKWQASIVSDGKRKYLGVFETPDAAGRAYINAKRAMHAGCTI